MKKEYKNLASEIKSGDKKAFEYVYDNYYQELCFYAYGMIKDPEEAEEIVQQIIFKLWDKKDELHIDYGVKDYLYKSVRNSCINYAKRQNIRNNYIEFLVNQPPGHIDSFDQVIEHELIEAINDAVKKLPDKAREAFTLNKLKGYKLREVAEIMGISIKNVEYYVRKSVLHLCDELKDYMTIFIIVMSFLFVIN